MYCSDLSLSPCLSVWSMQGRSWAFQQVGAFNYCFPSPLTPAVDFLAFPFSHVKLLVIFGEKPLSPQMLNGT